MVAYSGVDTPVSEKTDIQAITTMYSSPDDKAKASASDGLYEPSRDGDCDNQYELLEVGVSVFSNFFFCFC